MTDPTALNRTDATRALRKAESSAAAARNGGAFALTGAPLAAMSGAEPLPRRVLNYELGDQIGAGGMGLVYRAKHLWLERTVAIKFIAPQVLHNAEAIDRFRHECRAVGALASRRRSAAPTASSRGVSGKVRTNSSP